MNGVVWFAAGFLAVLAVYALYRRIGPVERRDVVIHWDADR